MFAVKTALLSVIIPVYNVEPYLEQCLDSVVNQTYKNLEIICINDGSTDNSLKILEKYQKKDNRIKLINQKNQGAAVARNAGLDSVTGNYITFIDSDDYLELNAYEEAMKIILQDKTVDLVEFREKAFCLDDTSINKARVKFISNWFDDEFRNKLPNVVIWNKIFKTDMIKKFNIRFIERMIHDDNFFSGACAICANKSKLLNLRLYNYRVRCNSISDDQVQLNYNNAMHTSYNYELLTTFAKNVNFYVKNKHFIYNRWIKQIHSFDNANMHLFDAIVYWDKQILSSDCPDYLKLKYLEKRDTITYTIEHKFEYTCYKIYEKLNGFFNIIK